ncbi:MAG: PD-(D/E)XK nuclease family protein [Clostridia bacterium]|nr:PD-(D/E)XK nuclease family protein [Clostridia bacterium]
MKIKLTSGATLTDATVAMLSKIDKGDFSKTHVIIVPDRFSLQCEKLVLNILGDALFNVRVISLTRFSVELLSQLGVMVKKGEVLSSGETLLLTSKAIENVCQNFTTFKKSGIDFCHEVGKLIAQFKSSGVGCDDLATTAGGLVGGKYHDLALIYSEYERLLGDKLDANKRLALLTEKLEGSDILKGHNIYFAQFDAFTKGGYDLIKTFAKCADSVEISFTQAQSIGNEYIYETDIMQKIKKLATEEGISVEVNSSTANFSPQKNALVKGLFSYQKVRCQNKGYYNLFSYQSDAEGIEAVCKLIRYMTFCGARYGDFQIAVGSLDGMAEHIEDIFALYDIPVYVDTSLTAQNTILGRLLSQYFEVAVMGYEGTKLVDLFSNPLAGGDENLIQKCLRYEVDGKNLYKKFIEREYSNAPILSSIADGKTAKDFCEVVRKIVGNCKDEFKNILENLTDLKTKNINLQVEEIIEEALGLIERECTGEISGSEFYKTLSLLLSFKQVSSVPTYMDGVFVGDATQSYFGEGKYLIILGGEKLPITQNDSAILSDDDLAVQSKNPIEPTIRMINRRNRFKLFSLLPLAEERLIVFARGLDDDGKKQDMPTYIKNLNDIFGVQEIKVGDIFFATKGSEKIMLLSAPNKKIAPKSIKRLQFLPILKDLTLKGDNARVTQVEQYFVCPFRHFANYGLKLKEFERAVFDARDSGNICHKGAELLMKEVIKGEDIAQMDSAWLADYIDKNFDYIIKSEGLTQKLDEVLHKQSLVKFIKKEMLVLFENIVEELKITKYRPSKIEYKFSNCHLVGTTTTLVGKADRIDVADNYFRVLDYKTGSTGNVLKELACGQKLQLFLYQKFAEESFGLKSGGAFYFDGKFDYSKDNKNRILLKGIATAEEEAIEKLDPNIMLGEKSTTSGIYIAKKDGLLKGSAISKYPNKTLIDYAQAITAKALGEIAGGYIAPKPVEGGCRGCKFAPLCKYQKSMGERKI